MKFDLNDERTQRKAGVIAIILGVLLVAGVGIYFLLSGGEKEPAESGQAGEAQLDDAEREALINEIDTKATGDEDIDPEKAKTVMGLKVVIPDEILELYLNGDQESLVREMEDFLVEYDFYMDVTKASCTGIVTMDYKKDIAYLEFKLNDPARTILTLEFRDHRKYEFNFR